MEENEEDLRKGPKGTGFKKTEGRGLTLITSHLRNSDRNLDLRKGQELISFFFFKVGHDDLSPFRVTPKEGRIILYNVR